MFLNKGEIMKYTIRKASLGDAEKLNYLLTLLIRDEKQYDPNINENFVVDKFYEDIILKNDNVIFVSVIDNNIVGYLYGYLVDEGDVCLNKISKIDAIYVLDEYRHLGIGSSLIKKFKNWSKENDVKYIEIQVFNSNKDAIDLYNNEGFRELKSTLINRI